MTAEDELRTLLTADEMLDVAASNRERAFDDPATLGKVWVLAGNWTVGPAGRIVEVVAAVTGDSPDYPLDHLRDRVRALINASEGSFSTLSDTATYQGVPVAGEQVADFVTIEVQASRT